MKHLVRLALPLATLIVPVHPAIHTLANISGTSAVVALASSGSDVARWIQVSAPSGNAAHIRFGDSATSSTRGIDIAPGGAYSTPTCQTCQYPLTGTYIYVATGDTASVAWGN